MATRAPSAASALAEPNPNPLDAAATAARFPEIPSSMLGHRRRVLSVGVAQVSDLIGRAGTPPTSMLGADRAIDDGAGGDDAAGPDGDAGQDRRPGADPRRRARS